MICPCNNFKSDQSKCHAIIIMIFYGVLDNIQQYCFEVKRLSVKIPDQSYSRLNWSGQQNFLITCTMGPRVPFFHQLKGQSDTCMYSVTKCGRFLYTCISYKLCCQGIINNLILSVDSPNIAQNQVT